MSIRPIDLNGMIQRTQDVGNIKLQEDNKPVVDQQNIQQQVVKEEQRLTKQVQHADDSNQPEYRYDAKEKGNGSYSGQKSKGKKKNDEGKKKPEEIKQGNFDIKI